MSAQGGTQRPEDGEGGEVIRLGWAAEALSWALTDMAVNGPVFVCDVDCSQGHLVDAGDDTCFRCGQVVFW